MTRLETLTLSTAILMFSTISFTSLSYAKDCITIESCDTKHLGGFGMGGIGPGPAGPSIRGGGAPRPGSPRGGTPKSGNKFEKSPSITIGGGDVFDSEKLGFFLSGQTLNISRKQTNLVNGFDSESAELIASGDYSFNKSLVAGLAISYSDNDLIYDASSGDVNSETVSTTLYGAYTLKENIFFNGYIGWAGSKIKGNRQFIGLNGIDEINAKYKTDADNFVIGISAFYDLYLGAFTFSPELSLDNSNTWIGGFSETNAGPGNLKVGDQSINSLISRTGFSSSYAWSQSWGVVIPQFRFYHYHEYSNDTRTVDVSLLNEPDKINGSDTDAPDRDYLTFALGVSAVMPHGVQLYIDYEKTLLHDYINSYTVNGGVRFAF